MGVQKPLASLDANVKLKRMKAKESKTKAFSLRDMKSTNEKSYYLAEVLPSEVLGVATSEGFPKVGSSFVSAVLIPFFSRAI